MKCGHVWGAHKKIVTQLSQNRPGNKEGIHHPPTSTYRFQNKAFNRVRPPGYIDFMILGRMLFSIKKTRYFTEVQYDGLSNKCLVSFA